MADTQPSIDGDPGTAGTTTGTATGTTWDITACSCGASFYGDSAEQQQWSTNHRCTQPHWPAPMAAIAQARYQTHTK